MHQEKYNASCQRVFGFTGWGLLKGSIAERERENMSEVVLVVVASMLWIDGYPFPWRAQIK